MQTTVSMTKPCAAVRGARAAAAAPARAAAVAAPRAAAISGRRSSLVAAAPAVAKRSAASRVVLAQAAPSATAVKYVAKQIPGDIGEAINAVRFLSIDGVNAANSGHPGLPMGCAPMATVLFSEYMKLNPEDPKWADRDRFVLSAGHGSMLQYSLLHLLGYPEMTVRFFFFLSERLLVVVRKTKTFLGALLFDWDSAGAAEGLLAVGVLYPLRRWKEFVDSSSQMPKK
jgi:hypothetical protein